MNALFALRQPAITITSLTVQLVAYPLGVGWYYAMPKRQFRLFGRSFSLNPGEFNIKEHTIIVVMANVNVAGGVAYATDTLTAQRGFYGQNLGWGFNLLLCISTQMIGYGLAGFFRKVLVWPGAVFQILLEQGELTCDSCYALANKLGQYRLILWSARQIQDRS